MAFYILLHTLIFHLIAQGFKSSLQSRDLRFFGGQDGGVFDFFGTTKKGTHGFRLSKECKLTAKYVLSKETGLV